MQLVVWGMDKNPCLPYAALISEQQMNGRFRSDCSKKNKTVVLVLVVALGMEKTQNRQDFAGSKIRLWAVDWLDPSDEGRS